MTPVITSNSQRYTGASDTKPRGNIFVSNTGCCQMLRFAHDGFVQFGVMVMRASWLTAPNNIVSMAAILLWSYPLQIIETIIRLISVDVISLMCPRRGGADKRLQNQSTEPKLSAFGMFAGSIQPDMVVSTLDDVGLQVNEHQRALQTGRFRALNVTEIGNTVAIFKTSQRHPLFFLHSFIISREVMS